jgi:L,D-peptidoglycan transpeptidase YkuD (ErfK/YbiS/YcfS/YnhG family)
MTTPFSGTFRPRGGRFVPQNVILALCAAAFISTAITASPSAAAATTPSHRQVVTVAVQSAASTSGVLKKWRWSDKKNGYVRVGKPIRSYVGEDGVGQASEYVSRTPAGVFTLTESFGRLSDPGTRLPYRQVDHSSWWVSDVTSPHYNTYRECSPGAWCGFRQSRSEQLGAISLYSHSLVIDYNRDPVIPGAGSAFFLHETEGKPTQGCVSIRRDQLSAVLRWLDPKKKPVISIGTGRDAYAAIGR